MKQFAKRTGIGLVALSVGFAGLATLSASSAMGASPRSSSNTISVGTLYASTGSFATSSMPEYAGLQFWAKQVNAHGGMYVAPAKKKEMVKIVSYNDQSDPATATTLYNQLLTQNHVNVLVSDFGSVLTAPAITIAKNQKHLLFDITGSGTSFFQNGANPYVVLTSLPVSAVWPKPVAGLLAKIKARKIAILFDQNDFDQAQAAAIKGFLHQEGITPVYYQGVPTTQTDYSTLVQSIKSSNPDAVLELGYPNNDIAFLNQLKASNLHFKFVLTPFLGQLPTLFNQDVGVSTVDYTYTYAVPPTLSINSVNTGLGLNAFVRAFAPGKPASVDFLNVAGYNAGLAVQEAFAHATSMSQLGIRAGITAVNGKMRTLEGVFNVNKTGEQVGELLPIAQAVPHGKGYTLKIVYPATASQKTMVNASPIYPAPTK
jgi:branched-chain amino acid transport system substrate-binding protein